MYKFLLPPSVFKVPLGVILSEFCNAEKTTTVCWSYQMVKEFGRLVEQF